jgi:hypothetical protein
VLTVEANDKESRDGMSVVVLAVTGQAVGLTVTDIVVKPLAKNVSLTVKENVRDVSSCTAGAVNCTVGPVVLDSSVVGPDIYDH